MSAYEIATRASIYAQQREVQATVTDLGRWERAARRSGHRANVRAIRREVRRIRSGISV